MKHKFWILSCILLIAVSLLLTGCKKPKPTPDPTDFNALGNWTDGGDEVYTITTNTTEKLAFTYDKGTKANAFMQSAEIEQDLSIFKKLVITVQGTGTMQVKLLAEDSTSKVVGLNVIANKGTYEWNLLESSEFLKKVNRIVIIAAPEKEESTGQIEVSELKFYNTVADNFIIQDDFNNIPSNVNEYNGTDDTFEFNAKWANFAEETYTITYEGTITKVSFDKPAGQEWSCMQTLVKGNFAKFNYVVLDVKGTEGLSMIAKAASGFEKRLNFDGTVQTVVVDISNMTDEQKNAIQSIIVFGLPGAPGSGSFEIHRAYMVEDYDTLPTMENVYNGTDKEFPLVYWYDNGDLVYDISHSGTDTIFDYTKKNGQEWSAAVSHIVGNISNFTKIEIEVTGTENKTALFKIEGTEGNKEQSITFDGTKQTITIDLKTMTKTTLQAVNKFVMFAAPGSTGTVENPLEGTVTIHSVTFKYDEYNFAEGWVSNDANVYTFTKQTDNTVKVDYNKPDGFSWAFMKHELADDMTPYNTMTLVLRGTADKRVLIKPNDNGQLEKWVTFAEGVDATVTVKCDLFNSVLIFAEPDAIATGSFTIVSAMFSYVTPPVDPSIEVNVNKNWVDNDGGIYTFTKVSEKIKVDYTRTTSQLWSFIKTTFADDLSNHNTLTMVVKGEAGKILKIKPNDNGNYERTVTFDGTEQTITFTFTDAPKNILIFVDPEGDNPSTTGTFEIVSAKVTYVPVDYNFADDTWNHSDQNIYTITPQTDNTIKVDYDKQTTEWSSINLTFGTEMEKFNTLTIVLRGPVGGRVLVKINNSNDYQNEVTFEEGVDATLTFTNTFTSIHLFAAPGTSGVSGTFTIVSGTLSYEEPQAVDPSITVDVNKNWTSNEDGIFTFTPQTDNSVKVDYTRTVEQNWKYIITTFEDDLSNHNTLTIVLKGTAGMKLIVKPNDSGSLEQRITLDGTEQTLTFTFTTRPTKILMFVDAEEVIPSTTGTFYIMSANVTCVNG